VKATLRASLLLFLVVACSTPPTPGADDAARERVRRIAAILDYVAGDYALAVRDGEVIDEAEYEEQSAFLTEARRIGGELAEPGKGALPELDARLVALLESVEAKASVEEVSASARTLRRDLLSAYGVVFAPATPPPADRGAELYAQLCAVCHGAQGAGNGPQAAGLEPPPTNFRDEETMLGLSPVRAFNALTDGIEGTAMISYQHLPVQERWALAFHVVGLRHEPDAAARGEAAVRRRGNLPPLARLAEANDEDLLGWLKGQGIEGEEAVDALAFLRRVAAYELGDRPLQQAKDLVRRAELAYAEGDRSAALDAVIAAYLDGFEPVEAVLSAREPALVGETETAFLRLREGIAGGAPASEVNARVEAVQRLLARAEIALEGSAGNQVAFVAALTILLREGVESVLLILLLLGLVRRTGLARDARMVHAGWIGAVAAGAVLWFVAQASLPLAGASRELLEGVIALLAAAVLLYASHFVLARLDAKRRVEAMRRRLEAAGAARRGAILFSLAFMAVFREAFEVVLFLQAILIESPNAGGAVLAGSAAGLGIALIFFLLLRATGRRLKPGLLLTASGLLLCGLAVVLTGKGVRALQEAGVIGATWVGGPRVDWLGLYPSVETLVAQFVVVAAVVAIALWGTRVKKASTESASGAAG